MYEYETISSILCFFIAIVGTIIMYDNNSNIVAGPSRVVRSRCWW